MMVPSVELRIALAPAVEREQPVRAHHAQHSGPGDADPVQDPQPRVHLPMTLALERRASEVRANGRQQLFVRVGRRRPAPCRLAPLPAPRHGRAPAAVPPPSTASQCDAWPCPAPRPPVPQPDPSAQARDRPGPAPSTPPGDIARPRSHATPRRATPRAAGAAQRPACGSRSTAAAAPGPPPRLPRRRRALQSPSGLPPSAPIQVPSRSLTEPCSQPPWTSDSPLLRVQENRRRLTFCWSGVERRDGAASLGEGMSFPVARCAYAAVRKRTDELGCDNADARVWHEISSSL